MVSAARHSHSIWGYQYLADLAIKLTASETRRGLRSWTTSWQQAPESSLNPNNENGPIPFTSSSLLGLAYVRIYLNLGPYRQLDTRDPTRIAKAMLKCPGVERSDGVISALLYATHALSIPVRLGVDRVARSQAFFWSVRHSLSALECAVLLSKWLCSLQSSVKAVPLTGVYKSDSAYLLTTNMTFTQAARIAYYTGFGALSKKHTQ